MVYLFIQIFYYSLTCANLAQVLRKYRFARALAQVLRKSCASEIAPKMFFRCKSTCASLAQDLRKLTCASQLAQVLRKTGASDLALKKHFGCNFACSRLAQDLRKSTCKITTASLTQDPLQDCATRGWLKKNSGFLPEKRKTQFFYNELQSLLTKTQISARLVFAKIKVVRVLHSSAKSLKFTWGLLDGCILFFSLASQYKEYYLF